MLEVRRCTVAELESSPDLDWLLAEYAEESSLAELGPARAQVDTYRKLEAAGVFYPIAAFDAGRLVGFILPIVVVLPHYGVLAATVESFFVPKAERKKGVGLRLLEAAIELARFLRAKALLISAPVDGVLGEVLPGRGFRHSNDVFIKGLA